MSPTLSLSLCVSRQGEEIVMTNVHLSWNDTVDPQACNTNPKDYEIFSRDVARTPMQWDDTKNAGKDISLKSLDGPVYQPISIHPVQVSAQRTKLGCPFRPIIIQTMFDSNNRSVSAI